ncbi:MAG: DedA family protein [Firmicutes bacterium]|nr:DedA family protein [Bacillota bacterium]
MQQVMLLFHHYGYLLIFAVLALEGTGMPGIPLEIVFLGAGYFIQSGRMSFLLAVVAAASGNIAGNIIGYFVGAAGRNLVIARDDEDEVRARAREGNYKHRFRFLRSRFIRSRDLVMIKRWFEKYGAFTVFISRWFGPIRTPAILAAGFIGLDMRKYLAASIMAASTWCFVWQLAAWKLGVGVLKFMRARTYLEVLGMRPFLWLLIAIVVLVLVGGYLYVLWRGSIRWRNRP